ncbi:MAG: DnaJ C-terminal domain-containing protein [Acidimicrobiia bacterium]
MNAIRREWLEKDYYQVLGVDRSTTERDIKKAYRKLAQQYHPDNNPDDEAAEQRFRDVTEAYGVLTDPKVRAEYDQAREAFARGAYAGGPGGGTEYIRVEDLGDLGDLLGGFGGFGDMFGRRGPQGGADLEAAIDLTFHEAIAGTTKTLNIAGKTVKVKMPAGVDDGARIRVRGKGHPGARGGQPGDLFVRVRVGSHPIFGRKGKQLTLEAPITFAEAALGADIAVPTLDGKVTLRIPPGTQTGRTFRVSGKGVKTPSATGDLLVTVTVRVPEKSTDEQRDLIAKLAELDDDDPRQHLGV